MQQRRHYRQNTGTGRLHQRRIRHGTRCGLGGIAAKLTAEKRPWQVINASISGDTTAGGRARLAQQLAQHQPQVLIVELGGNDAAALAANTSQPCCMTEMAQKLVRGCCY